MLTSSKNFCIILHDISSHAPCIMIIISVSFLSLATPTLLEAERDCSQSCCFSLSVKGDCDGKSSCLDLLTGMGSDAWKKKEDSCLKFKEQRMAAHQTGKKWNHLFVFPSLYVCTLAREQYYIQSANKLDVQTHSS